MHLRVSRQRRGDKIYSYAQLVESLRDERGKSTQRVVKHLGRLPEPVIVAIRAALQTQRDGNPPMLASEVEAALAVRDVASRRYLELAVLVDCWRHWGLTEVLGDLSGPSNATVPFAHVVLALAAQRCCAPGSKLEASRWVPETSLPEQLHFEPATFNNTRVHRALGTLHAITPDLQVALAERIQRSTGGFKALFMDVTDTWFEGMGCPLAEQTRTKTEMPNKRCIAIVLLVNEAGYPLRWSVVGGKTKDWTAMGGLLKQIGQVAWLKDVPIVFDRAMGNLATVAELSAAGHWFLTAAHRPSIVSYTTELRGSAAVFHDVALPLTDESYEEDIRTIAQTARAAGFEEVREHLFAIELGVRSPACEGEAKSTISTTSGRWSRRGLAAQLVRARMLQQRLDADPSMTRRQLGESEGISASRATQLLGLLRLTERIQNRIDQTDDVGLSESDVRPLCSLPPDEQQAAFDALIAAAPPTTSDSPTIDPEPRATIGPLRRVAYFNPRLFVDMRRRRRDHLEEIENHTAQVNEDLAAAKRSRQEAATYRKFTRVLERYSCLDAFDVQLDPMTRESKSGAHIKTFQGRVTLKPDVWRRRGTYDGFVLLVGHPKLPQTAAELVELYRAKDIVEKDFQSIKSVIRLRPLFHYSDPKVLAHVTVCMLALLLQRTLRNRLREAGVDDLSAPTAIDILSRCRLGQRAPHPLAATYHLTALDADQKRILTALEKCELGDQTQAVARMRHRE